MLNRIVEYRDTFRGKRPFATTGDTNGWAIKDTSPAGTPTLSSVTDGQTFTLGNTNEAAILTLYHGDVLGYRAADLLQVEYLLKVAGFDSVTTMVVGVCNAQNDDPANITKKAFFKVSGSSATVTIDTADTVTTRSGISTGGLTLGSTLKRLVIDFSFGLRNVKFSMSDANRVLQPVATGTVFDMSAIASTDYFQPYISLAKASGTGVQAFTIAEAYVRYKTNY